MPQRAGKRKGLHIVETACSCTRIRTLVPFPKSALVLMRLHDRRKRRPTILSGIAGKASRLVADLRDIFRAAWAIREFVALGLILVLALVIIGLSRAHHRSRLPTLATEAALAQGYRDVQFDKVIPLGHRGRNGAVACGRADGHPALYYGRGGRRDRLRVLDRHPEYYGRYHTTCSPLRPSPSARWNGAGPAG